MTNENVVPNGKNETAFRGVINTIVASSILALGGWTLTISQRVTKVESYDLRIDGLESGRTAQMGAETRAEFAALRRELADMRAASAEKDKRIGEMHAAHNRLMERLVDTVKAKSQ